MRANTIDEYLSLKDKGVREITFEIANKELWEFVQAEMKGDEIKILKKFMINTLDENYYYTLDSNFPFGRHKNNNLKLVYKCDPEYVEWCLLNADSFCIDEKSLTVLETINPWISDDLTFVNNGEQEFILDVRSFKKDSMGFPYDENVRETNFQFSTTAKKENLHKLNKKLSLYTVLRGSNWKSINPISFNGQTKKIIILIN